ncbi:His-Xaa-Ser system protein HxsD [Candidatus Woesearchaeota archaeon]|jgi:His-Xaa-Ser system protein HxsD|nr:His-Xaa-Ser system protein HxsD [Candidatus Woesearchaeota archaeon]
MEIKNLKIHDDYIEIKYNSKIYSQQMIFAAAYILIDKAYIIVDSNIKNELIVKIWSKEKINSDDLKKLAYEFNDELLNCLVYENQSIKNGKLREMILKRALISNMAPVVEKNEEEISKEDDYLKDEEDILIPWEEKYGK